MENNKKIKYAKFNSLPKKNTKKIDGSATIKKHE